MRSILVPILLVALPVAVVAETTRVALESLPSRQVYDVATLTPLAVSASGSPAVVLLDLDAGELVPPHAAEDGLRLLTVLSGDMSWGDGSTVDESKEVVHPPGSILTLPPGVDHWLAARNGPVRLQVVVLDDERPVPAILDQMR